MKKNTLIIAICCMLFSCGVSDDFDILSDERLYTSGNVVDTQGNLLVDIDVAIKSDGRTLGKSKTNAAGYFEFVAVKSNSQAFGVEVNLTKNTSLTGVVYVSFDTSINDLSLGTVTLQKEASLDFAIIKNSTTTTDLTYTITYAFLGENRICTETLTGQNPGNTNNMLPCIDTEIINDVITTDGTASARRNITSILSETVLFNYTLGNSNPVHVEIPLTNSTNSYEFEY